MSSLTNQDISDEGTTPQWNLDDVLPSRSGKLFQSAILDKLEGLLVEFENSRTELSDSITTERFMSLLENLEAIIRLRSRLGSYAYMHFTEDTGSQEARTFKSRVEEIDADSANRTLFFELWWKSLNDKKTNELKSSAIPFYYYLQKLIQTKQYTLAEQVEQAINLKDLTGRSMLLQIYHQIRDSFSYEVPIGGETKKLTEEQVRDLFYSGNSEDRTNGYLSMLRKFERNKDVLGEIYKALVKDWANEGLKLRKYASPIAIRNIGNDVPDEAVIAVLETCKENAILFQEFFKLKSRILELKEFSRTDIYAPLNVISEKTYSWDEGKKLVTDTFESFDKTFSEMAVTLFSKSHVDYQIRSGKIGGAYCMSVTPDITPYILMNYTGKARSVATLAHELGHAVHSQLSSRKNNMLSFEPALPLAETASVFAELLLTDRLLSESDENTRLSLLVELMNDSYATIMRQAFFVLYEMEAHKRISSGIDIDELCELYFSNLRNQFGNSVRLPEEFKYEWISIPHIYQSPFYCYSYAWGNLMVFSLYRLYKQEGAKSFAPKYIKLLSYGGSESPEKVLNEGGFDIRSRKFWQSGFDELKSMTSELKRIL